MLCYQIRMAFYTGEITPKEANRIGYELAMRWTKGHHAFLVTTHTDKKHIHCHIYYNSTSLDCSRKFRNFWGSSFALRRLCLAIDSALSKRPASLEEFLDLMKQSGYEVKKVRGGGLSFRLPGGGQDHFTRLCASMLGRRLRHEGYTGGY